MSKKLSPFFFPILITFIFTIFPLLFPFETEMEKTNKANINQFQNINQTTKTVSLTGFQLIKPGITEKLTVKDPLFLIIHK